MFLSLADFEELVLTRPGDQLVADYILKGPPYVFRKDAVALDVLRSHLAGRLSISKSSILVIGSAKTGFSLNPQNYPRPFGDTSDIDVVVIDEALFDQAWGTLLKWNYPRRIVPLGRVDGTWASMRRKDVYWGWFTPHTIQFEGISSPEVLHPLRDLSTRWFDAFRSLAEYTHHPELARRDVSGRLYRSLNHVALYHEEGLRLLRLSVQRRRGSGE